MADRYFYFEWNKVPRWGSVGSGGQSNEGEDNVKWQYCILCEKGLSDR